MCQVGSEKMRKGAHEMKRIKYRKGKRVGDGKHVVTTYDLRSGQRRVPYDWSADF